MNSLDPREPWTCESEILFLFEEASLGKIDQSHFTKGVTIEQILPGLRKAKEDGEQLKERLRENQRLLHRLESCIPQSVEERIMSHLLQALRDDRYLEKLDEETRCIISRQIDKLKVAQSRIQFIPV